VAGSRVTLHGGAGLPPPNSDKGTTGGDYMNDVWARARFYARFEDWITATLHQCKQPQPRPFFVREEKLWPTH